VGNAPSSGPTTFGAGRAVDLALPEGVYDIVLTAVDGSGSSQSTLTILVGVNQVYLPLLSR
jgi:hypothetical protein